LAGNNLVENRVMQNTAEKHHEMQNIAEKHHGWKQQDQNSWKSQGRGNWRGQQGRGRGRNSTPKQCSYYHRTNHIVDECYAKHGFPPWYKQKNDSSNSNQERSDQQSCNLSMKNKSSQENDKKGDNLFTPEQIQKILKLLQDTPHNHNINHIQRHGEIAPTTETQTGKISWILNTGATDHVTHDKNLFLTFYKIKPVCVKLPNESYVTAHLAGTIQFSRSFTIFDVLYIPEFTFNLLSVQKLIQDLNCKLTFSSKTCQIQDNSTSKMIGRADLNKGLYYLHQLSFIDKRHFCVNAMLNCKQSNIDVWHYRLGNPGVKTLEFICKQFPYIHPVSKEICDICHFAKQHKLSFQQSTTVSTNVFDLIHVDIWGPIAIPSVHGHRYFLTIVDDKTRHTWIFLMKNKIETRPLLLNFVIYDKNQFNHSIKVIRSDNGKEFDYNDLYERFGIIHERSCVETPQQNSIVERKHQHILNVARILLFQSNLPNNYWSYAVSHAIHLINKLPSVILNGKSPYELLHETPPTYLNLKVFGSLCFASTLENNRTKLQPGSRKCIFLGYKIGIKGYVLLDIVSREIFISINVIFYESNFPYKEHNINLNLTRATIIKTTLIFYKNLFMLPSICLEDLTFTGRMMKPQQRRS